MNVFQDDHRGHTIFPHASGPTGGPFVSSFSAWKIESNNSYRAMIQGAAPGVFQTVEAAHAAAMAEARSQLNKVLDAD